MDYQKVEIKHRNSHQRDSEVRFWSRFKSPVLVKEFAAVTSVHFSPSKPHDFAVTSSTRVQIYSPTSHTVKKTLSRFKDVAHSGCIRADGKLLVAGDSKGLVQVFDLGSRAVLKTFSGHKEAVRLTKFEQAHSHRIVSASDDRTVRLWDLLNESSVSVFAAHKDHVRTAAISPDNPHLIFSGSYDHTVKLWDVRANTSVMTMKHGAPVESIVILPGSSLLASAGSNRIMVWNIISGGTLFQTQANHQKTITTMCLDGGGTRLLTGSLDNQVKIYSLQDYRVMHSIKYPGAILSMAVSPDDTHLVVGMNSGLLSIRQRQVRTEDIARAQSRREELRGGTFRHFHRGANHKPQDGDIRIESKRVKRLKPYDKMLRSFQYGKAMDSVLETKQPAIVVVSLIEELIYRNGLKIALGGRDDIALEPVARFLVKHVTNPRYSKLLVYVANSVLDMYGSVIGESTIIDELFIKLRKKIYCELDVQEKLMETIGLLEALLIASQ